MPHLVPADPMSPAGRPTTARDAPPPVVRHGNRQPRRGNLLPRRLDFGDAPTDQPDR